MLLDDVCVFVFLCVGLLGEIIGVLCVLDVVFILQ